MKIEFLKDHNEYKAGDIIENHTNEKYLIILGVAKEFEKAKEPKKKKSD